MYSCKLPLLIIRCNELCCASKSEPFLVSCFITTFQQQQQQINVSTIPCMRYKCYSARPCIFMVTLTYRDDSFDSGSEKLPGLSQMFPSKGAGAFLDHPFDLTQESPFHKRLKSGLFDGHMCPFKKGLVLLSRKPCTNRLM